MAHRFLPGVALVILIVSFGCDKSQVSSILDPILKEGTQKVATRVVRQTGFGSLGQITRSTGTLISGEIGKLLDERDRQRASEATRKVLDNSSGPTENLGMTETWKSDNNPDISGSATVTAATITEDGRLCKVVHEVAYIGGKEVFQDVQYCRASDESGWTRVV